MKIHVAFVIVLLLILGVASMATRTFTASAQEACRITFDATVRQGPSQGMSWTGPLSLSIDPSGIVTGKLMPNDKMMGEVEVVGQVNGRAINLSFNLGSGQTLFAVGTLTHDIKLCTGRVGGPFVGPTPGDMGDWGYVVGG